MKFVKSSFLVFSALSALLLSNVANGDYSIRDQAVKPSNDVATIQYNLSDLIVCEKGTYLPKKSFKCIPCEASTGEYKIVIPDCPGGRFYFSTSKDQGLPNTIEFASDINNEANVTVYVTCGKGKYLPAGSLFCEQCLNGYICPKTGTYTQKDQNQGLETCPDGRTPNQDKTACVASNSGTNAGNSSNKNNNGTNSGNSSKNDNNTNTNNNGTNSGNSSKNDKTCPSILSKNQLKYGVSGDKECWLFLDIKPEKYKKCVCGE